MLTTYSDMIGLALMAIGLAGLLIVILLRPADTDPDSQPWDTPASIIVNTALIIGGLIVLFVI